MTGGRLSIRRDWTVLSLAAAVGAVLCAWALLPSHVDGTRIATGPGWVETRWTHPIDPWWPSKAFACDTATCGHALTLLLRAKIGFCNCTTGVADDEELERIGDLALVAAGHAAVSDGHAIAVGRMVGRSRPYALTAKSAGGGAGKALLVGYNDRCDAMVATALMREGEPAEVEAAVLSFLASPPVMRWTQRTLGR